MQHSLLTFEGNTNKQHRISNYSDNIQSHAAGSAGKKELMLERLREWVRDLQARYGARDKQACFPLQVSRSSFRFRSVAADDGAVSGRSRKPGYTMTIAGFTSCSGRRAGGIITNAFIDSTAGRVCPCVSNPRAGINRHSVDSPSLRAVSESFLGAWTLILTSYETGVGYVC